MSRSAAAYRRLITRLADTGEPLDLTAQDLAIVLAHEPTLLVDAVGNIIIAESIVKTLREERDLNIEMAACIGAAITGALKARARFRVKGDVSIELGRRRFEEAWRSSVPGVQ